MSEKHIKNYSRVRRMIERHYAEWTRKSRESLATAKDLLERVRKGEKGLKWPGDDLDATESDCLETIKCKEALLAPPWRGKPRKGSILCYRRAALARLDAADRAPVFTGLKVKIEWHRSRMWGFNPTADCWVFGEGNPVYTTKGGDGGIILDSRGNPYVHTTHYAVGHASGCGYDKRSAAMQEGLDCPTFDRLLIEHPKSWKCYAVDIYAGLPKLSISGKGAETLRNLFQTYREKPAIPGFEWRWDSGNSWDLIEVVPKRRRR